MSPRDPRFRRSRGGPGGSPPCMGIYTPASLGNMTYKPHTALTAALVAGIALTLAALAHLGGGTAPTAGPVAAAQTAPTTSLGCWTEHHTDDGTVERICGDLRLAPTGSDDFGPYPTPGHPMSTPTHN